MMKLYDWIKKEKKKGSDKEAQWNKESKEMMKK